MNPKMQDALVRRCAEVEGECNGNCNECPLGKVFADGAAWARKNIADTLAAEFRVADDIIEAIRSPGEDT